MAQVAYQYDRPAAKTPQLRVRKGGAAKRRARLNLVLVRRAAVVTLLLALVCSVVYSQAQLSEITMDIQTAQSQLSVAKTDNNYLTSELSSKTNMKNVEEVASEQLGLVKQDPSQVTYITMDEGGTVDKPQHKTQKLAGIFRSGLLSLMDCLNP